MDTQEAGNRFIAYCQNRKLSAETIKWYRVFIKVLNQKYPDLPTTPEPIEEVISSYPGQYRRLGCFRALRAFYNWTCDRDDIANPFRKMHSPRVQKQEKPTITLEQMRTLLEYPSHTKATRALLYTLCDLGCRIGEAGNIRREDIAEDKITIRGKTGERIVPISPNVRDMLLELKDTDFRRGKHALLKPGYVFQISTEQMIRWVSDAFDAVGMPGFHAHLLRHSFCTLFKGDLMSLRLITGHTNWQMLEHYRHNRLDAAQEAHANGSPLAQIGKNGNGSAPAVPVVVEDAKADILQHSGDKILIAVPAGMVIGKGLTLHIALS